MNHSLTPLYQQVNRPGGTWYEPGMTGAIHGHAPK